ncbi:MAG: thiol-disulfide oxidoreductase DCC family protein [Paracoccaceae bacterium]
MAYLVGMENPIPPGDLILFDGTCVFCSAFARLVARRDTARHFRFVTAHSPLGQALYRAHGLDPVAMTTNIVITNGTPHIKLRAFTAAMRRMGWPWRVFTVLDLIPRPIADPFYDFIARNRYRLGRRDCPLPTGELRARLIE